MFTIVVPMYNSSNTIRNCLDSIMSQTFKGDYEVIIINDGSSDTSAQICEEYTKNYDNVKLYNFENGGVAVSRRRGVKLATGEYVMFVDSDDTINENLLESVASVLSINEGIEIVRYQSNIINDESYKNHDRYNFMSNIDVVCNGMKALKMWTSSKFKYAAYWLFAFKRTLFSKIGVIPDLKCYEDVAYIPLLIASAKKVVTIGYHGYNYTYGRSDSLTNNVSIEKQKARANDFYSACKFAVENFSKLEFVSADDIEFFEKDYHRRLKSFVDSMDPELKEEFLKMHNVSI